MIRTVPFEFYTGRIKELTKQIQAGKQQSNRIAGLRMLVVLTAAFLTYILWGNWQLVIPVLIVAFAIFLKLISVSARLKQKFHNLQTLLTINHEEIGILNGDYTHRPDGSNLQQSHHPYSQDLDVLGKASLFQYIHRTTSEQGHQLLANWLLYHADETTIQKRQEAVKELRNKTEWRQQLQAHGAHHALNFSTHSSLTSWLAQPHHFSNKTGWKLARFILPGIILSLLILYITGMVPASIFYTMVLVFFGASAYVSKLVTPQYLQLSKNISQLETLSQTLRWIEAEKFEHELLKEVQASLRSLKTTGDRTALASRQVKALKGILDRMDYRLNPLVFIPLNTLLFWDLQQVFQLERWKEKHQLKLNDWFEAIAQTETLSSLATLSFNHPSWVFPVIRPDWFKLVCYEAGHPLIPAIKNITNDFAMEGHPQLAFITGSNMAGKSTFLRTIGTNLVLAMAGAPVCATQFETPVVKVMTSMRIADNLEESASTFYAELQKLKSILDEVKRGKERVFLLLDEILRGTNSLDRHTGSEALLKQLIKEDAIGMIASHDLSLAQLEEQFPGIIHNYHFDVTIQGNELSFDYKLKPGVCQTLNATLLMKKIGIDL